MPKLNLSRFKPVQLDLERYLAKLKSRGLAPDGRQVPDPTPMAPPVGYKKTPSMVEIVRNMVRSERLAQQAAEEGYESFEEADDFEVGDEPEELRSGWENDFDPPIKELTKAGAEEVAKRNKKAKEEPSKGEGVSGDVSPDAKPKA